MTNIPAAVLTQWKDERRNVDGEPDFVGAGASECEGGGGNDVACEWSVGEVITRAWRMWRLAVLAEGLDMLSS